MDQEDLTDERPGPVQSPMSTMTEARARAKPYESLPGPRGLPLLGNLLQLRLETLHDTLERWAERYGPLYRVSAGPVRMAVVCDVEAVRRVHRDRPDRFRHTRLVEAMGADLGMKGLLLTDGEEWRRQRRTVVKALGTGRLKPFFPALAICVGRLRRRWERAADTGEAVDLCNDLMRLTVDVITSFALGADFNTLQSEGPPLQRRLDEMFHVVRTRINAVFPYWRYLRLPRDRAFDRILEQVREEGSSMVREVRERLRNEPIRRTAPPSFLDEFVATNEAEEMNLSDEELFDNVVCLLFAGEEATAHTIAWAVSCLLDHPEHLARARAEVDAAVAPEGADEEIARTLRLPFLDAFLNEVMRIKPIAPLNAMQPVEDAEILDHLIPKNTIVVTLNRHLGMCDAHFEDAGRFDPERWLADAAPRRSPHDSSAFLPFGAGARYCPGRNLGLVQCRAVLAMLCRGFDFELKDLERPVGEKLLFTAMPTNLIVRMKRRTHSDRLERER